jgi:cation transport ATPase
VRRRNRSGCPDRCRGEAREPPAAFVRTGVDEVLRELGILIKGPDALEASRPIDTVVLDWTGTVTTGRMTVTESEDRGELFRR